MAEGPIELDMSLLLLSYLLGDNLVSQPWVKMTYR